MKPGLMLPNELVEQKPDFTKVSAGIAKRIAFQNQASKELKIMLDKWKQSSHTVKSSEDLINCIKGR